jgi:transposase
MLKYDGILFSGKGLKWLESQNIGIIDRQLVDACLKEMATINELVENVEKQIASIAINNKRVDLLLGFTGINYYGALLLINEIGDITRFSNPKKLVSWANLAPSLPQS